MTIELNLSLLEKEKINLNQLIFLSLVLNENQYKNQDVRKLVSQISDVEIQDLISKELVTLIEKGNTKVYNTTKKLLNDLKTERVNFDQFYNLYPIYVNRPDGTRGFLRANINKCRHEYDKVVGNSTAMSEHIYNCLKYQIDSLTANGKLAYMKTMWKWLVNREWEAIQDEMSYSSNNIQSYGTELI